MTEVWVLVGGVGRRRVVEVEGATFPVVGEVERREARAEAVGAVVKAGDPAAQVEVMDCAMDGERPCQCSAPACSSGDRLRGPRSSRPAPPP